MAEIEEIDVSGYPDCFAAVIRKFGREVFEVVWLAQMGGQAAERLAAQAEKRGSKDIAYATGVLSNAFNVVSNALCKVKGWTPEFLGEVDSAAKVAWAESQESGIGQGGSILLQ